MKPLNILTGILAIILFLNHPLEAQDSIRGKPRLFETWISSGSTLNPRINGILYEVKDSALTLSDSHYKHDYLTGNFRTTEIGFNQVEVVKLRKVNSVRTGLVTGSSIGLGLAIAGSFLLVGGKEFDPLMIPGLIVLVAGSTAAGAGIGALAGSVKTAIPLERNYDNFSRNRAKLQNYAVVKRGDYGVHEHESYLGLWQIGPSFAFGGFTDKTTEHYANKNGYGGGVLNLGFLFRPKLGISVGGFNQEYDVADDNQEMCWMFTGFVAGPFFAIPAGSKCLFDLKPRIGTTDVTFYTDKNHQTSVSGFVINPCVTFRFNFAKRWSLISETGFFNIMSRYKLYGQDQYQAFNVNAGIACRFR